MRRTVVRRAVARAVTVMLLVLLVFLLFPADVLASLSTSALAEEDGNVMTYLSLSAFAPIAPATNPPRVPSVPPPNLLPRKAPPAPPMRVEPRPRSPSAGPPGAPGWPYC